MGGGMCRGSLVISSDLLQNLYRATDTFDDSNPAWPGISDLKSPVSTEIVTARSFLTI